MRNLLSVSWIYDMFQSIVGTDNIRKYFVKNYLQPKPNERILDIGCGTAGVLNLIGDVDYVGFDPSHKYIEYAKNQFPNADFHSGDIEGLTYPERYFDKVIMMGVLHHLSDREAVKLLNFAKRSLKFGGTFVSFDMCRRKNIPFLAKVMNFLDRGGYVRSDEGYDVLIRGQMGEYKSYRYCGAARIPLSHFVAVYLNDKR
jgi:ubiquinone/menaquinone biosynthesis C-methylase UbiE